MSFSRFSRICVLLSVAMEPLFSFFLYSPFLLLLIYAFPLPHSNQQQPQLPPPQILSVPLLHELPRTHHRNGYYAGEANNQAWEFNKNQVVGLDKAGHPLLFLDREDPNNSPSFNPPTTVANRPLGDGVHTGAGAILQRTLTGTDIAALEQGNLVRDYPLVENPAAPVRASDGDPSRFNMNPFFDNNVDHIMTGGKGSSSGGTLPPSLATSGRGWEEMMNISAYERDHVLAEPHVGLVFGDKKDLVAAVLQAAHRLLGAPSAPSGPLAVSSSTQGAVKGNGAKGGGGEGGRGERIVLQEALREQVWESMSDPYGAGADVNGEDEEDGGDDEGRNYHLLIQHDVKRTAGTVGDEKEEVEANTEEGDHEDDLKEKEGEGDGTMKGKKGEDDEKGKREQVPEDEEREEEEEESGKEEESGEEESGEEEEYEQ
eukprot:Nk52_evm1s191 gene=Nk52_evmTU1s191